ncbi:putative positive regulation of antifungal peptide biosynthetic process [Trypoxylus dichotomus]
MSHSNLYRQIVEQYFRNAPNNLSGVTKEDKNSLFECSTSDSGFISSGNIIPLSEEISWEEIRPERKSPTVDSGVIDVNLKTPEFISDISMKLDSGVDLALSQSFSNLHLDLKDKNDLNSGSCLPSGSTSNIEYNVSNIPEKQQWELYYEQDENGDTCLHEAILSGFPEMALVLIRATPVPRLLDTANDDEQTALHLAVATGQAQITRWLIVAGARPCPRNLQGDSPLHIAARLGDVQCCRAITDPVALQEREALNLSYPVQPYCPVDLDQWNYDGQTCVHVAALNGRIDVLRHLNWYGADINAREGKCGYTALHIAIQRGDEKLTNFLLDECKKLDVEAETYGGRTVLELGCPIKQWIEHALRQRGIPSPYISDDDDDEDEDMLYEATNMLNQSLAIGASA